MQLSGDTREPSVYKTRFYNMFACTVMHANNPSDDLCPWKKPQTFFTKLTERLRPQSTNHSFTLPQLSRRDSI